MKLIKPKFEILEQEVKCTASDAEAKRKELINGVYSQIEIAGRTCYKSEDKITDDSAEKFVNMMIKSGHGAMLEHGTVYLKTTVEDFTNGTLNNKNKWSKLRHNPFTRIREIWGIVYITTNYRVIIENKLEELLAYICEPTEYHEKRITVRFTCDRVTGESFLRHRVFSFARESTRYCNYSKDKFGNELTFIIPNWCDMPEGDYMFWDGDWCSIDKTHILKHYDDDATDTFLNSLSTSETSYFKALNCGWKPQQARDILPFSIKSPLIMTGFTSDWEHFFKLRDDAHAHPQAQELAHPLHEEFIKRGYIK